MNKMAAKLLLRASNLGQQQQEEEKQDSHKNK